MSELECRTSDTFTVQNVEASKDGVHILFSDRELVLDTSSYTDLFLYPGKELDEEEFHHVVSLSERRSAIHYVSKLLCNRRYTYKQLFDKVRMKFQLKEEDIHEILFPYTQSGILDDEKYALDYIQLGLEEGYYFPYLKQKLIEKGIHRELLSALDESRFDVDQEESILNRISLLDKRKKQFPLRKRKADIMSLFLERGFDSSLCRELIENFYSSKGEDEKEKDRENELMLLKKRVKECYNSLRNRGLSSHDLREKMIQRLVSKGFAYDSVVKEMDKEGF